VVVDQLNHTVGLRRGLFLFLVRWEDDVHPGFGDDAQDVVNQQIDFTSIDLFIGILWKRFGTATKRAASGTEEEFNQCFKLWKKTRQPYLMLYFNTLAFTMDRKELSQHGKVLAFKERLAEEGALTGQYQGLESFKDTLRKDLTLFIDRHAETMGRSGPVTFPSPSQPSARAERRLGSTFKKTTALREHGSSVQSLAFSPDDRLLASGDRSGAILLWDMEKVERGQRALIKKFTGHHGAVRHLGFSIDGRGLVSGSEDYEVRIWDVDRAPAEAERVLIKGFSNNRFAAFAPGGRLVAMEGNGVFRIKDAVTFADVAQWPTHRAPAEVWKFSPDGALLASAHSDGALLLWNIAEERLERLLRETGECPLALAFSPDSALIALCGHESTVRVWDARSGNQMAELAHGAQRVGTLTFNRSGRYLASGDIDGLIVTWKRQ
jgi:WD40 repeat protein